MAAKTLTVTRVKSGKRWKITIEGADSNLRVMVQDAIRMIAQGENVRLVNAADPFGGQEASDG